MAKRLDIRYSETTSASIDGNYLKSMRDLYMSQYGRRMLGWAGGSSTLYRFDGIFIEARTIRRTKTKVVSQDRKQPDIDISRLVILGGPFEKIGERDEAIGGGSQKVGSANQ